jgi:hypothetical protein
LVVSPDLPDAMVMFDSAIVSPEAARAGSPASLEGLRSLDYVPVLRSFVSDERLLSTDDRARYAKILAGMEGRGLLVPHSSG